MVVPIGLLCGRLINRGLQPSLEAVGLATGLCLTLMTSLRVGHGIRRLTQGMLSPSLSVRFTLAAGAIGVLIAVVYHERWLPTIHPRTALTEWAKVAKQIFIVSLAVLIILQLPAASGGSGATMDQQQLGQRVHATLPSDATVYVHSSAHSPIYAFVFYAQQPLQGAVSQQIRTDPDIQYVIISQSAAEKLDRPHERIGTMTAWKDPLVLVRLDNAITAR